MSDVTAELLTEAADYCAKLAAVEHAHILGDEETVDLLLAGVDPIDARLMANTLYALAKLRGTTDGAVSSGSPTAVSPLPNRVTSDLSPTAGGQASAPTYPLTHIDDNWSKKVPCE